MLVASHTYTPTSDDSSNDSSNRYEQRIGMLLKAFVEHGLTAEERKRFYVLGGECHYLLQVNEHAKLIPIPELEWVGKECHGW